MFIVYIAFGIASGLFAAFVTLMSGSGILMALAAYFIAGVAGMVFAICWSLVPQRTTIGKTPLTQRS